MEKDIRILLVDDHQVVREGLQCMLEREEDMEEVQLVIPPIEANHLITFVSQVEEMFSCSVRQMVSSGQEGTAIILSLMRATPLADILNKLAEMPEVEAIVEKPPPRETLLSLLKKSAGLSRINPKTILVTLKHTYIRRPVAPRWPQVP